MVKFFRRRLNRLGTWEIPAVVGSQ